MSEEEFVDHLLGLPVFRACSALNWSQWEYAARVWNRVVTDFSAPGLDPYTNPARLRERGTLEERCVDIQIFFTALEIALFSGFLWVVGGLLYNRMYPKPELKKA